MHPRIKIPRPVFNLEAIPHIVEILSFFCNLHFRLRIVIPFSCV